jgi:hypothetical protein
MKHTLTSVRALAATLITFGSLAGGANGATLTFGNTALFGAAPYTELGLVVTSTSGSNGIFDPASGFSSHFFTYDAPTTTASIALDPLGTATAFDLYTLDIGLGPFSGASSTDITFTGTLFGGGTVSTSFLGVNSVSNVALNWTGLTSVTISGTEDLGIDNVNFTMVPEPSAAILLGLCSLGLVARRRRIK